ncbi:MAG: DUF5320 family protein [Dehalococcoidales bacterium]|nr:DUF5320 family protein [Dehalococcoidales bacterium]
MKIAISAAGPTLEAEVDPRFGRCQHFIIADSETMDFEAVDNTSAMASGGAGIATAQVIASKGVQAVLTGNCGPNAHQVLSAAGIQVVTGASGKIKDAIQDYVSGKFQASSQANVPDHSGMNAAPGMQAGGGSGMGGGMGRGGGMGKGRGMGRGMGMGAGMPSPANQTPEQDIKALREQSQALAQQLAEMQRKIEDMEKKGK